MNKSCKHRRNTPTLEIHLQSVFKQWKRSTFFQLCGHFRVKCWGDQIRDTDPRQQVIMTGKDAGITKHVSNHLTVKLFMQDASS